MAPKTKISGAFIAKEFDENVVCVSMEIILYSTVIFSGRYDSMFLFSFSYKAVSAIIKKLLDISATYTVSLKRIFFKNSFKWVFEKSDCEYPLKKKRPK